MENSATFKIQGMHCASCAAIIEENIADMEGINKVRVNFDTKSMNVTFDADKTNAQTFANQIKILGYTLVVPKEAGEATSIDMKIEGEI